MKAFNVIKEYFHKVYMCREFSEYFINNPYIQGITL